MLDCPRLQAEKRSQSGDLAFLRELAQKVLSVLERPTRSSGRLETPEGDTKDGRHLNPEIPDPNTGQWGLNCDLITETTVLSNPDSGICEIPEILEIQGSGGNLTESLIPARKPRMSDYEPSRLIGSGAFGSVCLVHHKDSHQAFAMKKMVKRNLNTPEKVERAFLERDILSFADCPFVVSMLCSFPTKSHLCMVMEYVEGGDCGTLLNILGPLPVPMARLYFAEAILAVEYLHSIGVVHRDLKPENLLLTSGGHIKVTDFGLSKVGLMIPKRNIYKELTEDITREFLDTEVCGTPYYIAPEVFLEEGYGRPVDWWSMGIILHELLVGLVPFDGDSICEIYASVVIGDINWDCEVVPPYDAQNIITLLLTTNPAHRLGTGGAFEIKAHPFLRDIDFENLLSQKPEFVPELLSDTAKSLFIPRSDINKHLVSEDEEDTSEDNGSLDFQNFTSSSERLGKLCTSATRTMSDEYPKSSPECTPASGTTISEIQKESSVCDRDAAISSSPSSPPMSEFPAKKERKFLKNLRKEQGKSQNAEKGKKRGGSILRRILSSCRRGLSRVARAFAGCNCSPRFI